MLTVDCASPVPPPSSNRERDDHPYRDAWSVSFGPMPGVREIVLLAPPRAHCDLAFFLSRPLLDAGQPVRIVGVGVTAAARWPAWVHEVKARLTLSELDGYLPANKAAKIAGLMPTFERWLDRLLGEVTPGSPPGQAFYSTAMERILKEHAEAYLLARGLAVYHSQDEIRCLDPSWAGDRILRRLKSLDTESPSMPGLAHFATTAAVSVAAVARRLREFRRDAPARARLRAERLARAQNKPRIWLAVLGHWPLNSRPVIEAVAPIVRRRGEKVGILLQGSLSAGLWRTPFWNRVERDAVLPTLDHAALAGIVGAVDQGVSVETWSQLIGCIGRSLRYTARALRRSQKIFLEIPLGEDAFTVPVPPLPFAKLIAYDVLRAREAWEATEALKARHDFSQAVVLWPHATNVNDGVTDRLLQSAGATTIEIVHGLSELMNQLLSARTATTLKLNWSHVEAEALAALRPAQRCLGGYYARAIPKRIERPRLGAEARVPILFASNYLVSAYGQDPRVVAHYQPQIVEEMLLAAKRDGRVDLRWRPHPGDDPRLIEELMCRYPILKRSTQTLEEDLAWCRVLVTSHSTVACEALFWDVPIFIHEIPRWDAVNLSIYEPERLFGFTHSLAQVLPRCLDALRAGAQDVLDPEARLRARMFGSNGQPSSIENVLWPVEALKS